MPRRLVAAPIVAGGAIGLALPFVATPRASADFLGIAVIDHGVILPGTRTDRLYAAFSDPADRLLAIEGTPATPLVFAASAALVQDAPPLEDFAITDAPSIFDLAHADSWVSIGGNRMAGQSDTAFSLGFLGGDGTQSVIVGDHFETDSGAWFDAHPLTPEGDGAIIAQFTLPTGAIFSLQGRARWLDADGTSRTSPFAVPLLIPDCNGNFVVDAIDIENGTSQDCNDNGIPDECEITDGSEPDENGNGIPDSCESACGGDLDGDGSVGFGDLVALLASWGPCPKGGPCPGDLDGDGAVAFGDVVGLLAAWGRCP